MPIKIGVSGTRFNNDYANFCLLFNSALSDLNDHIALIISGGAKGVDTMAGRWAREHQIPLSEHKPDWDKFGKGAAFIRNKEIVDECDVLIAFPLANGESHGTENTIATARKQGKKVIVQTLEKME
jgi:predicted Rossmann fold nucleotide-binding protein DprA/Smf involved in DNA uptake